MQTQTASPIGGLYLEAQRRAKQKASRQHTCEAPCECRVSVSWFTEDSHSVRFEPCHEHADRKII